MFAKIRCIPKYFRSNKPLAEQAIKMMRANIYTTVWRLDDKPLPNIVDINFEDMMFENREQASEFKYPMCEEEEESPEMGGNSTSSLVDRNGAPLAPIDIDPWRQPGEAQQGTVDLEQNEEKKAIEYPPIPMERNGIYEFKGIKLKLPQRMLRPETYRYRMEAADQFMADDIRVCKFDKLPN